MSERRITINLTGREVAILACVLRRCKGWDDPRELERFLTTAADQVRPGGFTEAEMEALSEKLAGAWIAAREGLAALVNYAADYMDAMIESLDDGVDAKLVAESSKMGIQRVRDRLAALLKEN